MHRPTSALALASAVLLALSAAQAMATGFGPMRNASSLGQRLDFAVPLRLDAGESLAADCVTAEVIAGEFRIPPSAVRVAVEPGSGFDERIVRVATNLAIDEPVVTVTVNVGCASGLTRKFVAFVDPPVINLASAATSSPPPAAAPRATPRTEVAIAPPAAAPRDEAPAPAAPPPPAKRKRSAGASSSAPSAASPAVARSAKLGDTTRRTRKPTATRVAAAAPAAKGARLSLEAPAPEVLLAQVPLRLSDTLPAVLPPAAPQAAASEAAAESAAQREKIEALEASFAKLLADSKATQASLVQLRAQLRESESARYANPLVYVLIGLVVLLGLGVAYLLTQRVGARRAAPQWWAQPTGAGVAALEAEVDAPDASRSAPGPAAVSPELWDAPEQDHETTGSPHLLAPADVAPSAAAPLAAQREMSVEELIDLEQQAEFFVVLGQDEAAIDLLMGHVRSSGGTSPLPYLKLLEIYRRRDDREAYERTRDKFNRRFNAYAPDWDADLTKGRTLEDYDRVVSKLQGLWSSPAQTMQTLEGSLFRRDPGASNFDLPAYRELLFLYSVARDLSEHAPQPAASTKVDVLLPIDAETSATGTLTRLHPTRPMPIAPDAYTTQVDVDITTLDAGPSGPDGPPSRYQTDFNTTPGYIGLAGDKATGSA